MTKRIIQRKIRSPQLTRIEVEVKPKRVNLKSSGGGNSDELIKPESSSPPNRVKFIPTIEIAFKKLIKHVGKTAAYTPARVKICKHDSKWKAMVVDYSNSAEIAANPKLP